MGIGLTERTGMKRKVTGLSVYLKLNELFQHKSVSILTVLMIENVGLKPVIFQLSGLVKNTILQLKINFTIRVQLFTN